MKDSLSEINEECTSLTLAQKNSEDISTFTSVLALLCGLELLAIVLLYIKEGYSIILLSFIAVVLIMLFAYKRRLSSAAALVEEHKPKNQDESDVERIIGKIAYLNAGLSLKLARIKGIKWFYIIVFPIFLLNVQQLSKGIIETSYSHWILPVLFLLSFFIWNWVFHQDGDKIDVVINRVAYLKKQVKL